MFYGLCMRGFASCLILCLQLGIATGRIACPQPGIDDYLQVTIQKKFKLVKSSPGSLCVLVHLALKEGATSTFPATKSSKFSDFSLTPVARSYNGLSWEKVAGPYSKKLRVRKCNSKRCILKIPPISPYSETGQFYLMSFAEERTFQEELSRFFSQTTFGGTLDMINGWSYTEDITGMAQFVKDQIALPVSSLRKEFRKGADFNLVGDTFGAAAVTPIHPCSKFSRWRDYAFTSAGDFGKLFTVSSISGGLLIKVDGMPRTIVSEFKTKGNEYSGTGDYDMGFRIAEAIGGEEILIRKRPNSLYKGLFGGNPKVVLNNAAIRTDDEIIVINLPDRGSNFDELGYVLTPDIQDTPASGSIRMKVDISNNPSSNCDAIPALANYKKVLGKFPDGSYVWFAGYAELQENTEENPVADGGIAKKAAGIEFCSNAAKNFHNIEKCSVSEELACDGSPHNYWSPQPHLANTVVCGSRDEVANDLGAPQEETSVYQFQGVGPSSFYSGYFVQKMAVWYKIKLTALDQFRHRAAWALSQIFIVTQNQIDNGSLWAEMFLNYEDIFVHNAFGNYKDILREVSYSPMMAEMLSFLDSTSSLYALQREGRISRPDENYAREIMQLFTIGLYELNMDGTYIEKDGVRVQTYDNVDIQTLAKAWTGFSRQGTRTNYEGYKWNPNKIDPMYLNGEKRDPFPKSDLGNGYIGDGYPLCKDLPPRDFLRKGATFRAVGNYNRPELKPETGWWKDFKDVTRTVLETSSELYKALCNANGGSKCNYSAIVRLSEDIGCTGVECSVDTLNLIKIQDSPPLYYEYMPFPCTEFAFGTNLTKVANVYSKAMCAEPETKDIIFDACCPSPDVSTPYWKNKAWSYCEYTAEKISFSSNKERCESEGGTVCDWELYANPSGNEKCNVGIPSFYNSWRWTNQTCFTQVKVDNSGLVSIVHNPNLDVNSILNTWNPPKPQSVHQPVNIENQNFFKVRWKDNAFPTVGQCGECQQVADGCLCNILIKEDRIFTKTPKLAKRVPAKLNIGSPPPEWRQDYELVSDDRGIEVYVLPRDKDYFPQLTTRAILGILHNGEMKYFCNYKSIVTVTDGSKEFSFRNPVSMVKLHEQRHIDAYYETEALLDHYVQHKNTAPFVANLLIKRLVTSNPSPKYIERVAQAFKTGNFTMNGIEFGDASYGNLEATFAAVILDSEARNFVLDADPTFGSLKEPLLKLFAFMRAMEFKLNDRGPTLRMESMINKVGQEPFASPNVFSFFLPGFADPGNVRDASLTSPEAQIINAPTVIGFLNGIMSLVDLGLTECYGGFGLRTVWGCVVYRNLDPEKYSRGTLSYTPTTETASTVVDEIALLLTSGRLTESSRRALETVYDETNQSKGKEKALKMVQKLIAMTPEFHTSSVFRSIEEERPEPEQPPAPTNSYKAIVYFNLDGGLDSFNTLVPHSGCAGKDMFDEYKNVRGSVAVEKNSLRQISVTGQVCTKFGVHEKLPIVQKLYNDGQLGFFANMGVLQQPTNDKINYRTLNKKTALFAHNTQQEEINSVDINDDTAGLGVCGRMADILSLNGYSTGTVSVAGGAPAVVSKNSPLLVVNPYGYEQFNPISWEPVDRANIKELNKATGVGSSLLTELWSGRIFQAMSENDILYQQMSSATTSVTFSSDSMGLQLSSIAKLIKTKDARKTDRDVFYAKTAGFDTHILQENGLDSLLMSLDKALSSFVQEMKNQGQWNNVAIVFVSEFGRTLVSNTGNGTDHAWGGNYFAASGKLKGGKIFGEYPDDLTSDGARIVSDVGIVMPTTPWEALWNGIAEWFGIASENDLKSILPNRDPFENNLYKGSDLFKN